LLPFPEEEGEVSEEEELEEEELELESEELESEELESEEEDPLLDFKFLLMRSLFFLLSSTLAS
jgi:hypothetical protein